MIAEIWPVDIRDSLLLRGELFVPRTEEISRKVRIFLLLGYVPFLCASFESIFLSRASRDSSMAWAELDFQESGVGVRVIEELLLPKQSGSTVGESQRPRQVQLPHQVPCIYSQQGGYKE